ncbi:methylmalonyl-CoA mutase subunit beta [Poritiphilus flavus]|uniref:Methylmalonyl-CoA mutase n=1 Tax=Poritiphilus flavus TaxID=2697053 RepID=A0A6L9E9G3_9FLAO|nr:methylmalonyl-CoA mutase subunit beta [Poritiphilus flavus]NAS11407.1 methylmalonyl-CoA mutase [Poritiphilus flavus]
MNSNKLFEEFPKVSAKAWKQQIQAGLRGADYNESLLWGSPEGIVVKPFYSLEDLEDLNITVSSAPEEWKVGQEIQLDAISTANEKIKDTLNRGAESLLINIPSQQVELEGLFTGVDLTRIPLHLNFEEYPGESFIPKLEALQLKVASLYLGLDPVGQFARQGSWRGSQDEDLSLAMDICKKHSGNEKYFPLNVDIGLYQNAGANTVQQLAYGMAHANEYLQLLDDLGLDTIGISFKVAIGGNYFFEIAKLRALRLLWSKLSEAYGIKVNFHLIAFPSKRNKVLYDYNTNLLRTSIECLSAIVGGADTICNLPYDGLYHEDNEFADRLARNQLLILKHESYLDKVANPADGSYYIETLTRQLSEKALDLFKKLEKGGGFLRQLKDHQIQKKIRESAAKEQEAFDNSAEILVGTNKYQNPADRMKSEIKRDPFLKTDRRKTSIEPVLERRLSEETEKKRLSHE